MLPVAKPLSEEKLLPLRLFQLVVPLCIIHPFSSLWHSKKDFASSQTPFKALTHHKHLPEQLTFHVSHGGVHLLLPLMERASRKAPRHGHMVQHRLLTSLLLCLEASKSFCAIVKPRNASLALFQFL